MGQLLRWVYYGNNIMHLSKIIVIPLCKNKQKHICYYKKFKYILSYIVKWGSTNTSGDIGVLFMWKFLHTNYSCGAESSLEVDLGVWLLCQNGFSPSCLIKGK